MTATHTVPLAPDAETYRAVRVRIDGCHEGWTVPAYWSGECWNGWAVPYFTLDGMREMAGHVPELIDNGNGTFSWMDDDLEEGEPREVFEPLSQPTGLGATEPLYVLSGWCFELAA